MIGETFGPYRIVGLLGRGGMGEVYRAVDTGQRGRSVALTVLPAGLSTDRGFVARFRREAEIAARIAEPHVVPMHRYGEIDGRLFVDMQLVDGRDLHTVIAQDGPLAPARAVAIVEQVAAALDAAQDDGLVHRAVRPANILVTDPGNAHPEFAHLAGLGIAGAVEPGSRTALTRTGSAVGTLAYLAPERFLARPAGPPADVYALACVLYEALTGARPYPGSGYAAQVVGHLEQPPPRPSTLTAAVPPALDAVVARGMAKQAHDRHARAGELAADARRALTAGGAAPFPAPFVPAWTPPAPPPRRPGRSGWIAAGGAALLAVALVTTLVVTNAPGVAPTSTSAPGAAEPGAPAVPSGGPITDRAFPGRAPGSGDITIGFLAGRPVLLDAELFEPYEVIDVVTGEPIGTPLAPDLGGGATVTPLDGRAVIVAADGNRIRVFDVATGDPLPTVMLGHTGVITALTVVDAAGGPVVVSTGTDRTIRRFDLRTGAAIGDPITDGPATTLRFVVVRAGNSLVIMADGPDGALRTWNLSTGAAGPTIPVTGLVVGAVEVSGRPTVIGYRGRDYMLYDILTGEVVLSGRIDTGATVSAMSIMMVDGRPHLVSVEDGDSMQLRDLETGDPIGAPMVGHEGAVLRMRAVPVDGRAYLFTSSDDRSVRIWDLTARIPI